jgi:BCCT family betaine/carnitine transporter
MESVTDRASAPPIDRVMLVVVLLVVVSACIPLGLMPERASAFVSNLYDGLTSNFGFLYQWSAVGVIVFLAWLAFGRFGSVRLGPHNEPPDFSMFSWAGMLFCAGTGAALLSWGAVEWVAYYNSPPFGAEPGSAEAIRWATAYGPFHWGVVAWCIYALPTVAIAYPFYVKRVPHLCASTACHGLMGPEAHRSLFGRLVNLAAVLGILGGAGTSLGFIAPLIAASVAELFGIATSFRLEGLAIVVCVALFGGSVYLGLEAGIKRLSDLNVVLFGLLLAYILLVGPTLFILKMSTETIGYMAANFVRMLTWTDPIRDTGFVESWTIFFWAWWIAFAPVVGTFVTRISRGRTIRQVILGMICLGSAGCWVFFFVLGNYALFLEIEGLLPLREIVAASGISVATAKTLATLPASTVALLTMAVVGIVSAATSYDSASYTIAATVTRELGPAENPGRAHRLFWALVLGILPLFMLFVGGLQVIRLASLLASLPILFAGVVMAVALTKSLRSDERARRSERG